VVPVSGGGTERQVTLMQDFGARCCAPRLLCAGASRRRGAAGDRPAPGRAAVGMFGAEPWSAAMRARSRRASASRRVDVYGLSEIMGPGVACECECRTACTAGRTTSCSR
jgi:phenylacetate-CoA ligase